jgi:prophage regulatory protein
MLGVSRTQVHRLTTRRDFPKPVAVLEAGRIWRRRDVERWDAAHPRRPGRPEKPYPPKR